ncbi:UNVERIFIED_CONTAM: hypothetical protein Slati_0494400 [Sesamum latifolium]|uniref:Uncharacterized protein n=1 Tax=Sesamum latifolium TaxID=2727402 RepID=A0AAW2XZW0_9LAMI
MVKFRSDISRHVYYRKWAERRADALDAKNFIPRWDIEGLKAEHEVEVEQLEQKNQQPCDQIDDLRDHIDQLAEMTPDEPEENPEEDPMEDQDDDNEITEGSIIDGEDSSFLKVCKIDFDNPIHFCNHVMCIGYNWYRGRMAIVLLSQLSIVSQHLPPIAVHCDSQTIIPKVRSRKYNQKTKQHIQVRLKSIRALVSDRVVGIDFVGIKDNVADPLTKGLDLSQVYKSRLGMRLKIHQ